MSKPIVFVSHIHEEALVAVTFKELIDRAFLGLIDTFVSSDRGSISLGEQWFAEMIGALSHSSVAIIVASPASVKRPWVNFEIGAAWVRGVPILPLCHSGANPGNLPLPLNLLQAGMATDPLSLSAMLRKLSETLGSSVPQMDLSAFVAGVREFEEKYSFWDRCNGTFGTLLSIVPPETIQRFLDYLKNPTGEIELQVVRQTDVVNLESAISFLRANKLLEIVATNTMGFGPGGVDRVFILRPMENLQSIANDGRFMPKMPPQSKQ